MGTPDFAVGTLRKLAEVGKNIVGVITAPDRPAGRGRKLMASAVKEYALSKNLKVLQPTNLKDAIFLKELASIKPDLQIVVAFRMLPKVVWQMPKYGTFNLHASLLPQYRGAAPINWAVINGEVKTGVTTFFIDEKIDTGSIILKREVSIAADETAGSLLDKLMDLGAHLVLQTVELIENGPVATSTQALNDSLKEAPKLTPENTKINWNLPGRQIENFIRGLSPYPTAWSTITNEGQELKTKIYSAHFEKATHKKAFGSLQVSKKEIAVAVQDGCIHITELQLPGKRKMDSASLLNGYLFDAEAKFM